MSQSRSILALDVGEVRTGVALADVHIRIAVPRGTITMDEATFRDDIANVVAQCDVDTVVIGYPRNQSGEPTRQTAYVERMAGLLEGIDATIVFQDESLTSVMAKERLKSEPKDRKKGDIDAEAASIILQDYLEQCA